MRNDNNIDGCDDYEYVKAEIIKEAVFGDDLAYNYIFNRFERYIVKLIVSRIRKLDLYEGYFPIEDLKQSIWIGMREAVRKYRPK